MEMHERIKELRKDHLHLSQEAFGKCLGVSRSVINNIERNCLARPDQKLSLIKLMCKEFNISEEWLLHGIGPMYIEAETFSLDDFAHQHGATNDEIEFLKYYFELDKNIRQALFSHFKNRFSGTSYDRAPKTSEEMEDKFTPVDTTEDNVG